MTHPNSELSFNMALDFFYWLLVRTVQWMMIFMSFCLHALSYGCAGALAGLMAYVMSFDSGRAPHPVGDLIFLGLSLAVGAGIGSIYGIWSFCSNFEFPSEDPLHEAITYMGSFFKSDATPCSKLQEIASEAYVVPIAISVDDVQPSAPLKPL